MSFCKREMRGRRKERHNVIHEFELVLDTSNCSSNNSSIFFFLLTKSRVGLGNRMLSIRGLIMTVLSNLVHLSSFISLNDSLNIFLNAHHMPNTILGVRKTQIFWWRRQKTINKIYSISESDKIIQRRMK